MRGCESPGLQIIFPNWLDEPGHPVRAQAEEVRVDGAVPSQLRGPLLPFLLPEVRAPPGNQES